MKQNVDKMIHGIFFGDVMNIFKFGGIIGISHTNTNSDISFLRYFKLVRNLYAHIAGKLDQKVISKIVEYQIEQELLPDLDRLDWNYEKVLRIKDSRFITRIYEIIGRFDESFLRWYYSLAFPKKSIIY